MQTRSKNNTTANSKLPNNYKLAQKEFGCWHVQNWQSWCISSPDFEKKSGFQTPVWCLSWLDYPLQTGKGSNVISTRRIHRFWTNQLAPTSPNLRVCFKKIAHCRILLEELCVMKWGMKKGILFVTSNHRFIFQQSTNTFLMNVNLF